MVWNKNLVIIKSYESDGIKVKFENGTEVILNTDNIYDIIENTPMGTTEILFTGEDANSAAVHITVSNRGKSIIVQAVFELNIVNVYPIADVSPSGLLKWLKRIPKAQEDENSLFDINMRG